MKSTIRYSADNTKDNGSLDHEPVDSSTQLAACFKVCCKSRMSFGLEDAFWLLFLIMIILLAILKATQRLSWSQMLYLGTGSMIVLVVIYLITTVINKFCFEDAATAHWNAHARFTQAALQARLQQEDHKVHVIAPPRMGGAKLNILYTVGDVPILATGRALADSGGNNQFRVTPSSSITSNRSGTGGGGSGKSGDICPPSYVQTNSVTDNRSAAPVVTVGAAIVNNNHDNNTQSPPSPTTTYESYDKY